MSNPVETGRLLYGALHPVLCAGKREMQGNTVRGGMHKNMHKIQYMHTQMNISNIKTQKKPA
jgi:hypothetical protein